MKRDVLYNRIILSVFLLSLVSCVAIYFAQQTNQYNTNFWECNWCFWQLGRLLVLEFLGSR